MENTTNIRIPYKRGRGQRMYSFTITGVTLLTPCEGCGKQFDRTKHELVLHEHSWVDGATSEHDEDSHWCRECSKDAIEWERFDAKVAEELQRKKNYNQNHRSKVQKAVASGDFDAYYDEEEGYYILRINPSITII